MKNTIYLVLFSVLFTLMSCSKDPIADAEVRFRLRYEDKPLVTLEEVTYPDGKSLYFSRVSLFIENFNLIGDESTTLIDRDYFTLTDDHLSDAEAQMGTLIFKGELEQDDYTASFNIGVDAVNNAKVPADFTSDNVLSNPAEYWPGWNSYIFAKFEGFIDLDGDGDEETGFALHLGADDAYRSISINRSMKLSEDNPALFIDIQLEKLFMNNGVMYDISANPQIHSREQNPIVIMLSDNMVTCFE